MRTAFTLGLALCTVLSLKEVNMNTDANKQVVRELYQLLNSRKLDSVEAFVDPTCVGPNGEKGAAGLFGTVAPIITAFPDIQWTVDDLIAEGDKVVIRWSWVGTNTGVYRGVPPSGKKFTNHAMAIYQLKEGKIVRGWMETDRLGFLQQAGLVKENLFPAPLVTAPQ